MTLNWLTSKLYAGLEIHFPKIVKRIYSKGLINFILDVWKMFLKILN